MDDRMKGLIAIGASVAADCKVGLKYYLERARENGTPEREILEAMEMAKYIKLMTKPTLAQRHIVN